MADRSSQLILAALSQAATGPMPLHGNKSTPGLFPTSTQGKQAALRCQQEGFLQLAENVDQDSTENFTTSANKGRSPGPLYTISERGLNYLLKQFHPRQVLEDFVRVLEARQTQMDDLCMLAQQMSINLETIKASTSHALRYLQHQGFPGTPRPPRTAHSNDRFKDQKAAPEFPREGEAPEQPGSTTPISTGGPSGAFIDLILQILRRWRTTDPSHDCPLPQLFQLVQKEVAASPSENARPGYTCETKAECSDGRSPSRPWSIGQFHDVLRHMYEKSLLYLHPWTGPLHELPQPSCALLVGHMIAYYASTRENALQNTGNANTQDSSTVACSRVSLSQEHNGVNAPGSTGVAILPRT